MKGREKMSEWYCRCGYKMDSKESSDSRALSVFSNGLIKRITQNPDKQEEILRNATSDEYFFMWRCPLCHNFMVFEEPWSRKRFAYYKRLPEIVDESKRSYYIVVVKLDSTDEVYYFSDDESINGGDVIEVPTNEVDVVARVTVSHSYYCSRTFLPCPIENLRKVIRKCSDFDGETSTAVANELLRSKDILNLSDADSIVPQHQSFSILQTPFGHFWLELNGVPVQMAVEEVTLDSLVPNEDFDDKEYVAPRTLSIKPASTTIRTFTSLKLCADFDMDSMDWFKDVEEGLFFAEIWERDLYQFGLSMRQSEEFQDEYGTDRYSRVPHYKRWHLECAEQYEFRLSWKEWEWDEDWSVDFYTTSEKVK